MAEAIQQAAPDVARKKKSALKEQAEANQPSLKRSAYLQKKMAVSSPGDSHEQEADRVADEVSRMPKAAPKNAGVAPGSLTPESQTGSPQSIQTKISRATAESETADRQASEESEPVNRSADAEEVARSEDSEVAQTVSRIESSANAENDSEGNSNETGAPEVSDETEQKIDAMRGNGQPLSDAVRDDMETKLKSDFSHVNIHDNADANALCGQLNARAFTVGSDIFFASGEYAPDTAKGKKLLAHELTHVVQQGGKVSRTIYREVTPAPSVESGSEAETKLNELSTLELPPIKHRHAALYGGHEVKRQAGYRRNTSEEQVNVWKRGTDLTEETIAAKIQTQLQQSDPDAVFTIPQSQYAQITFNVPGRSTPISGQWRGLRNRLLIPDWDRRGNFLTERSEKFQVDHMIELQVYGDSTGNAGNVIGNLELLKGSPNASSGSAIKTKIYQRVYAFLEAQDPDFSSLASSTRATRRRNFLNQHTISFDNVVRGEGRAGTDTDWWTKAEIEAGDHLDIIQPVPATRLEGTSGRFLLASGPGGIEIRRYRYTDLASVTPRNRSEREALAGVSITSIALNSQVETGTEGANVGTLHATWNLPSGYRTGEAVEIPLIGVGPYCAAPGQIPSINTEFEHLSPVNLTAPEIRDGKIYSEGTIDPSLPLLSGTQLSAVLDGIDVRFTATYNAGQLSLPIPGLSIEDSSVSLFYSTEEGFGGGGSVEFAINNLGAGSLTIEASQRSGFSAEGSFDFDSELFDRAQITVWYRDGAFGGSGEIGIDDPNKIKGIRSANLNVSFGENAFSAEGDVQPNIPGVEQAGLMVSYSEEEGLTIGGNLQLNSETPGIESGSIEVTLNKQEDVWKVAAEGEATPSIPGINSTLRVNYNDGAFTAEVNADYSRGMLSGAIHVGVTNRTVNEEGQLTDTTEEGAPLIVFGGGSLTLQLAPWLQGTAGVEFAPNGEITITGEIGLPDQLEIFSRYEVDKSIFRVAVQTPIYPGIIAEISGGLSAQAGFGPGVIDDLRLGVTYNPDREQDTTVTGDAHLNIPADAGLRLSVRAGIGLGIPGVSVTGGLDIGGTLGIEGAAEAGVHVEWSPAQGLHIDANVGIHAQPSFTFDIGGYVTARALFVEVYDNRWEFASYTFGSDYRFGVNLPIEYREGEPFDISLDDVEFEVPDINTSDLLSSLIDRIS